MQLRFPIWSWMRSGTLRQFVCVLLATSCLAVLRAGAQSPGEPRVISLRAGASIDSLEQEYFGLFRTVKDFAGAELRPYQGGVEIVIARNRHADSTIHLDEHDAIELARYIDMYEEIVAGDASVDRKLYEDHQLNDRVADVRSVRIDTRTGEFIDGRIIHLDERGIILWTSEENYRWQNLADNVVAIPTAAVDRARRGGELLFGVITGITYLGTTIAIAYLDDADRPKALPFVLSIAFGGLAGAGGSAMFALDDDINGDAVAFEEMMPKVRSERMFYAVEPPELRRFADSAFEHPMIALSEPTRTRPQFSVALLGGGTLDAPDPVYLPGSSVVREPALLSTGATFTIDGTYDINNWLDAALVIEARSSESVGTVEARTIAEIGISALADINLLPRRRWGRQQFELLVGAGIGIVNAPVYGRVLTSNSVIVMSGERAELAPVVVARAQLRFSVAEPISLQLGVHARLSNDIEMEGFDAMFPTTREPVSWVTAPSINLSSIKAQAGVRIWL
ncbi:MAG: hypothetical protein H7X80_03795 [bacterium]|nr:hypothetical protein [Candidatus Kapabacteria bacterium]